MRIREGESPFGIAAGPAVRAGEIASIRELKRLRRQLTRSDNGSISSEADQSDATFLSLRARSATVGDFYAGCACPPYPTNALICAQRLGWTH